MQLQTIKRYLFLRSNILIEHSEIPAETWQIYVYNFLDHDNMTLNSKSDGLTLAQVYVHTDHNFPLVCFNNHNDRFCVVQGVIITQYKLLFYWYNSALLCN